MKVCKNCGTQLTDDTLFCTNCGTRLVDNAPKDNGSRAQTDGNKSILKIMIIAMGGIILIGIIVILIIILRKIIIPYLKKCPI